MAGLEPLEYIMGIISNIFSAPVAPVAPVAPAPKGFFERIAEKDQAWSEKRHERKLEVITARNSFRFAAEVEAPAASAAPASAAILDWAVRNPERAMALGATAATAVAAAIKWVSSRKPAPAGEPTAK